MYDDIFSVLQEDDEEEQSLLGTTEQGDVYDDIFSVLETEQPTLVEEPEIVFQGFDEVYEEEDELGMATNAPAIRSYNDLLKNKDIQNAAIRFVKDKYGKEVDGKEAVQEVISHFRSFNVNEMTAGSDWNYVSAAKADSESGQSYADKGQQRLNDYRTVYNAFNSMPDFWEAEGAPGAFGDYASGIFTAPSTYVGLLLPGFGKGAGISANIAAKTSVAAMLGAAASRPVLTTMGVEAGAGALQDIAAQKTLIEADLQDEYSVGQTALVAGVSGALPAAMTLNAVKKGAGSIIDATTPDILAEANAAAQKARQAAGKKAQETIKKNKSQAKNLENKLDALNPEKVAEGEAKKRTVADAAEISDSFTVAFLPEKRETVTAAVIDFAKASKLKIEPEERVSAFLARAFNSMPKEKAEAVAKDVFDKYNLTQDDFSNMLLADYSQAGKTLKEASDLRKIFDAADTEIFALDKEAKRILKETTEAAEKGNNRSVLEVTKGGIRALDQLRLSMMTSQVATTYRNTVSGGVRVGMDFATKILDRAIATGMKGVGGTRKGLEFGPNNDAFAVIAGLSNRKRTNAIMEVFKSSYPAQAGRLFRELADLEKTGQNGALTDGLRRVGREFNTLNTMSDNFFKGAAFVGELERALNDRFTFAVAKARKAGDPLPDAADFNLTEIVRKGNLNKMFQGKEGKELLDDVINKTLYFTYQRNPQGPLGQALVRAMNKAPFLTTSLVPFPRFIANALRFTYEYSPLYLMTGVRKALAKDQSNYEELSKGLVGLGMLYAGMAFRESEYAGENWWEGKTADGRTYDMRPFFPAAPYLFFGDLINKYRSGNLEEVDKNVVIGSIQALTGTQMRAGFGLYAMDSAVLDYMNADPNDGDRLRKIGANFAANIVSTYSIPLTVAQDLDNTFLAPDDQRIARQTDSSDTMSLIVNKSLARLPRNFVIERKISELYGTRPSEMYESPTREEPIRRETPITRQTRGILYQSRKNKLESEMDRLKIRRSEMYKKTRVPEANQLISLFMGEYASDYLVPVVIESDYYKNLDDMGKKKYLKFHISKYRTEILESVREYSRMYGPERYTFDPYNLAEFQSLDPYYRDMAIEMYENAYGTLDKDNPAQIDEIVKAAKWLKSNKNFNIEGGN